MNLLWDLLATTAARHGGVEALCDGRRRFSWGQVLRRCSDLAAWLRSEGVGPGDRVAVLLPNGHPFLEASFAVAGLKAILVPLNLRLSPRELGEILAAAGVELLLAHSEMAACVAELRAQRPMRVLWAGAASTPIPDGDARWENAIGEASAFVPSDSAPDDPAQLYYTSGTTGNPKGVILTHGNVRAHAETVIDELAIIDADVWAHIAPMFHLADAWATFAITAAGGRHVMLPRFEARAALALLEAEVVTLTNLIPTMLNLMLKDPSVESVNLSAMRLVMSGGAPIAEDLVRRVLKTFGGDYVQTYGMTETSPYLTLGLLPEHLDALPFEERLRWKALTGRPFRAVELRVLDAGGCEVPADGQTVGEIHVRGSTVTPGYWRDPEATRAAFARGGWLRTGDLAVRHAEDFIDIVDRKKDVIITGGENVYSIEVENVLYDHPAVLEAATFGVPDATWGEVVAAAVVPRAGASVASADLEALCRQRLASFKVPRIWRFLAALPKTGSGKIAKRRLRGGGE